MKTCVRCGKAKPATSFPKTRNRSGVDRPCNRAKATEDGRRRQCHACDKAILRRRAGRKTSAEVRANAKRRRRARSLAQFRRLLRKLLKQRCIDSGQLVDTIEYRAAYRANPVFRAKEIARRWARKERDRCILSDGSLTPIVIQQLFAVASVCPYCAGLLDPREKTLDHILPLARGGAHSLTNVVVCCRSCNSKKQDRTPSEWRLSA